jgi:SNF2 family DNA or RNA helicase
MTKAGGLVRKIPPLFPDQKKSVDFELKNERVTDWSEPGTGKTRVRIEVHAKRRVAGSGCALVLAPKSLLRSAWEADAKKYAPWMATSVAFASNREDAFAAKADMYITNHDAVKWLAKQPASFFKRFDYLVVDESDAFKHHTSQRSKALAKIRKHFKYRCIMNGVPTPNGVCDIWHQVFVVDDGKRLGGSFYAFRAAVCTPEQVGPQPNMVKWIDRPGVEEQVSALLKDVSLRNKLTGVPKNTGYTVPFYLSKPHLARYEEMERDAIVQLKSGQVTAVNAAALSTKLLQIASGAVYDEHGNYHVISHDRYELVADLIEARKNTVVFFLWTHQRDLLIEEMKKRKLTYMVIDGSVTDKQRAENVQMYEAGMFRTCFLHPKSAAHGLTLVRGKATIWPSPTHDLAWWLQGNARIARKGQVDETETISVLGQGTYEEKVFSRMGDKNVKLIDLLRSIEE